jgi:CRISPR system Cascade subunit CasD
MTVLLLRLAGPLQSWGAASRFARRDTRHEPTKSGVVGLFAAAQGRHRTDPVDDLAATTYGVRIDQPGQILRDFHTARSIDGSRLMPLSYRFYLSDAVFLAGIEGPRDLLDDLDTAVRDPVFPLYLGRRSCPSSGQLTLGVHAGDLQSVLQHHPWQAAPWWRREQPRHVRLRIIRDTTGPHETGELIRDLPVSFSPERREYDWRLAVHGAPAELTNPDSPPCRGSPDFLAVLDDA